MAINLTPEQEAARDTLRDETYPANVAAADKAIALLQVSKDALAEQDEILRLYQENSVEIRNSYENERSSINGIKRDDDITQGGIDSFVIHDGRLHNNDITYIESVPVRIDAFDFPTAQTVLDHYENKYSIHEIELRDAFENGFWGNTTVGLFGTLNNLSESIQIEAGAGLQVGKLLLIDNGSSSCLCRVLSITNVPAIPEEVGDPGADPPVLPSDGILEHDEVGIEIMTSFLFDFAPELDIVGGDTVEGGPTPPQIVYAGITWTNVERTNKIAGTANNGFQRFLNYHRHMLVQLKSFMSDQNVFIDGNLDDEIDTVYQNTLAQTIAQLNGLIIDDDFSDTGLLNINTYSDQRVTDKNGRITGINNRLPVFYDKFYNFINSRLNKNAGSYYQLQKLGAVEVMFEEKKQLSTDTGNNL